MGKNRTTPWHSDPDWSFCVKNTLSNVFCKLLESDNKIVHTLMVPVVFVAIWVHEHRVGKWRRKTRAAAAERRANMPKWEDRPADAEFIGWCYKTKRYIWKKSDSDYFEYLYSPPSESNWS